MKTNYPLICHTTMLNGNLGDLNEFIQLAKEEGIRLNPPHINHSQYKSIIEDEESKTIRLGFNGVKGIGEVAVESITLNAPYDTVNDFFIKNSSKATNKKVVETLIDCGAFEGLGIDIEDTDIKDELKDTFNIKDNIIYLNRNQLRIWYDKYIELNAKKTISNFLFDKMLIKQRLLEQYNMVEEKEGGYVIPETLLPEFNLKEEQGAKTRKKPKGDLKNLTQDPMKIIPNWRRAIIDLQGQLASVKFDPLETYLTEFENNGFSFLPHPAASVAPVLQAFKNIEDGQELIALGIVTGLFEKKTKTDKTYYILTLNTNFELLPITLWSNQYKKYKSLIQKNAILKVKGTKGYGRLSCMSLEESKFNKKNKYSS